MTTKIFVRPGLKIYQAKKESAYAASIVGKEEPVLEAKHYVFYLSDDSGFSLQSTAVETFNFLVREKSVWPFGPRTFYRKRLKPGDRVLFYVVKSKQFLGAATLKTGAFYDRSREFRQLVRDPNSYRINLESVLSFETPILRKALNLSWIPRQGGCSAITRKEFETVLEAGYEARKEA